MKYSDIDVLEINKILFIVKEKQPSLFKQICIFIGQLFYYTFVIHFKYKELPKNYKGLLFFGLSLNNQRSLEPIIENITDDTYLYLHNHTTDVHKRRAWWHCIPYLFTLISLYKKSDKDTKSLIIRHFTSLWTTYGLYEVARETLEHYKVKVLVVSNDHNDINRCLIYNAKALNIKTVYVQHASVKKGFPQLEFSYSFLDGKESLEKYLLDGQPLGEVYLSGGVRFDLIYDKIRKREGDVKRIGIAINMLDDFEKVKSLCNMLKNNGFNDLILRPHPRYKHLDTEWLLSNGIAISSPKEESSFDFIAKIDFMISNESAIHLDSAIMYCPSVLYNMSNNVVLDDYGFVAKGLTKLATDEPSLLQSIVNHKEMMPARDVIRYYNASSGTHLEGKLGVAIAGFIENLAAGSESDFDKKNGFMKTTEYLHEIDL
jgi:hypothetical protein